MALQRWFDQAAEHSQSNGGGVIAGAPKALGLTVTRDEWRQAAEDMATDGGRLLSLWASRDGGGGRYRPSRIYCRRRRARILSLPLTAGASRLSWDRAMVSECQPHATRRDGSVRIASTDADTRPWLRHAAWPRDLSSVNPRRCAAIAAVPVTDHYAFVPVEGDGVHEIPVGPVHAGDHRARSFPLLGGR